MLDAMSATLMDRLSGVSTLPAYLLMGGHVLAPDGASFVDHLAVKVAGGRIVQIMPVEFAPAGLPVVDIQNHWVVPGLIDVHVHSEDWHAPLYLANGVTAVRDVGCALEEVIGRRRAWSAVGAQAPRLVCCGPLIDGPAKDTWTEMSVVVSTPEDACAAVDRCVDAGVDQIKLYASLDAPCFLAALERAHHHNKHVLAHLQRHLDARAAILLGVDEVEHLSGCAEAMAGPARSDGPHWSGEWLERTASLLELILQHRTWMAVTRAVWHKIGTVWDPRHAEHRQFAYAPAFLTEWWRQQYPLQMPDSQKLAWIRTLAAMGIFTSLLVEFGARIIAGSDSPFVHLAPGFGLHEELQLLVECGLSPLAALRAATIDAATAIGLGDQVGSLTVGCRADLLLLPADPTLDVRVLSRPVAVARDGRWFDPAALLEKAAHYASTAERGPYRRMSAAY